MHAPTSLITAIKLHSSTDANGVPRLHVSVELGCRRWVEVIDVVADGLISHIVENNGIAHAVALARAAEERGDHRR